MSRHRITQRQREIIRLIADGYDTAGIAEQLGIGKWTVKDHVRRLCRDYDCRMIDLPIRTGMSQRHE